MDSDMFRRMMSEGEPTISHVGQIARLREFKDRLDGGCTFEVGDMVTPRKDAPIKGAGGPQLIVAVRTAPPYDFAAGEGGEPSFGGVFDIRCASFMHGKWRLPPPRRGRHSAAAAQAA